MDSSRKQKIGQLLRRIRKYSFGNCEKQVVADLCGAPPQTYGQWENGYVEPRAKSLIRIATILGISLDALDRYLDGDDDVAISYPDSLETAWARVNGENVPEKEGQGTGLSSIFIEIEELDDPTMLLDVINVASDKLKKTLSGAS